MKRYVEKEINCLIGKPGGLLFDRRQSLCRVQVFAFLIILVMLSTFVTCKSKPKSIEIITDDYNPGKIDSILVTYFCGMIQTDDAIKCEELAEIQEQHPRDSEIPAQLIDTFIIDRLVLDTIAGLLEKRTPVADFSEDARVFVCIKYKNGLKNYLCMGQHAGLQPVPVKYNGAPCNMDRKLFFLLLHYSGYYMWLNHSNLKYFDELQDSVFYQKAVEQIIP